jgi:exodeoxyribonuclease VIII
VDPSTVDWWKQQSSEAVTALSVNQRPIEEVLININAFCDKHSVQYLIGNGSTFDNAILRDACKEFNVEYPVNFWEDMDLRTMKLLAGMKGKNNFPKALTPHVAIDDAIFEAMVAQTCWRLTRVTRG